MTTKMTGKQLQALRAKLGLTQPELAKLLSVHWSTVARWEQGVYPIAPAMATLIRLIAKQQGGAA